MKPICLLLFCCAYWMIQAQNIGINTTSPQYDLDVRGTSNTTDGGELQLATPGETNFLRFFGGRLGDRNPFIAFHEMDTFHLVTTSPDWSTFTSRLSMLPNGWLGLGTKLPLLEMDIRTASANDGAELGVGNLDNSYFLRMYSGKTSLPHSIIYWNTGTDLQLATADSDGTNYHHFLGLNGKTIGVFSTGQSVFVGEGAGENDDVSDNRNMAIGNWSLFNNTTGYSNTAIGDSAMYTSLDGTHSIAIGQNALFSSVSDSQNIAIGSYAGYHTNGGVSNVFIGDEAGKANTTGSYNTFVGHLAAIQCDIGRSNTALGAYAAWALSTGDGNTAIGHFAGAGIAEGNDNVYIGQGSGLNIAGPLNNSENVVIGRSAGYDDPGNKNVLIGYKAGDGLKSSTRNTIIGHQAASSTFDTVSNCVIIGADAGTSNDRDNSLFIDNSSTSTPLIYGEFDSDLLRINGRQEVTGELNIAKTGIAMRINGLEALWSNANYFSWGFGTGHNYFAKALRIGPVEGSTTPFADLHVVDNSGITNLTIESHSSDAVLQLAGNTNSSTDDWTIRRQGSNGDLVFRHSNLRKMTMTSAGNLGLGVSNPQHLLDMAGTFKLTTTLNGVNNYIATFTNNSNNNAFHNDGIEIIAGHSAFNSKTNNLIRFADPVGNELGRISQTAASTLQYINSSDRRLKTNIQPTQYGLADLLTIEVKDYYWKSDTQKQMLQTGFIAQQMYAAYPPAAAVGGDDFQKKPWGVAPMQLIPLLVKGTQEQQEAIESLQEENAVLKNRLDQLEKLVNVLIADKS